MTKNTMIKALSLFGLCAVAIVACEERMESDSMITNFPDAGLALTSAPETAAEVNEDTITVVMSLNGNQVNDLTLEIAQAQSSTAIEGEDFELSTHSIDLLAFGGQDTFTFDVYVHEDFLAEGGDPEQIVLEFSSTDPSGVKEQEIVVGSIVDSGITPTPAPEIHITSAWADVDLPFGDFDGCDIADFDIYVYDGALENEVSGFGGATAACPESFTLDLSGQPNGTYYVIADLWDLAYSDFGEFGPVALPISTTFERGMTAGDEVTTHEIAQTADTITTSDPVGAPTGFVTYVFLAEIHYADGVYTIVDQDGNETAMRQNTARIREAILKAREGAGRGK